MLDFLHMYNFYSKAFSPVLCLHYRLLFKIVQPEHCDILFERGILKFIFYTGENFKVYHILSTGSSHFFFQASPPPPLLITRHLNTGLLLP